MDTTEPTNNSTPQQSASPDKTQTPVPNVIQRPIDIELIKSFFSLTGGSLFYCLSAVFVAYGIVKMLGPVLESSTALKDALPCLLTLHVYELALLVALIIVVSKKVVDDAISITIIIAIFLVATCIAQGSVAENAISTSLYMALAGIALLFGKLYAMQRFTQIPFRCLSIVGLGVIMAYNYIGPILMARSITVDPADEPARRSLWLLLTLVMMLGAGIVILEAAKTRPQKDNDKTPFLKSPAMVYLFALILLCASGVHKYAMAYSFALERVIGDSVPIIAVYALLAIQILRHIDKRPGYTEVLISCAPFAVMIFAIYHKSVLASSEFGIGLICYPPVLLAIIGLAIAAIALYKRYYIMLIAAFVYALGVILTFGFSPEKPHDLNIYTCVVTLITTLMIYGIVIRNQFVCMASVVIFCIGLTQWSQLPDFAKNQQISEFAVIVGTFGLVTLILSIVFGRNFHKALKFFGALALALFLLEFLPETFTLRYLYAVVLIIVLIILMRIRAKDIIAAMILCLAYLIKIFIAAKQLAHWRMIILGFLLLAAGTSVSLMKRPKKESSAEKDS